MGNCLKSPTSDDISLLHESQSDRASFGEGTEPDQEPPPPYQVGRVCVGVREEAARALCPWPPRPRLGGWGGVALTPSGLALRVSAARFPNGKGSFWASPWARVEDGLLSLSSGIECVILSPSVPSSLACGVEDDMVFLPLCLSCVISSSDCQEDYGFCVACHPLPPYICVFVYDPPHSFVNWLW